MIEARMDQKRKRGSYEESEEMREDVTLEETEGGDKRCRSRGKKERIEGVWTTSISSNVQEISHHLRIYRSISSGSILLPVQMFPYFPSPPWRIPSFLTCSPLL